MDSISIPVTTKAIEPNKRIVIEWPGYRDPTTVEWTFASQPDGTTFVNIKETGFVGNRDELVKQVADSTQGFSLVLAGLKALLEHNVRLNLVADRYPTPLSEHVVELIHGDDDLLLRSGLDRPWPRPASVPEV